jgi:hypothetical protein
MSPQCQQARGVVYTSISQRAAAQRNIGERHLACRCAPRGMPA